MRSLSLLSLNIKFCTATWIQYLFESLLCRLWMLYLALMAFFFERVRKCRLTCRTLAFSDGIKKLVVLNNRNTIKCTSSLLGWHWSISQTKDTKCCVNLQFTYAKVSLIPDTTFHKVLLRMACGESSKSCKVWWLGTFLQALYFWLKLL